MTTVGRTRVPNDPRQYDELADQWWNPEGTFASLSWIARCRAALVPTATRTDAVLVDVACGGGLLHPHLAGKGYTHVGVDLSAESGRVARAHGVDHVIRGDMNRIPLADESADVVTAGQCLEHVSDPARVIAECCRILRPGGTLVVDTIPDTLIARLLIITLAENLPLRVKAPKGCHDHRLFVNRAGLVRAAAAHGVPLRLQGLTPKKSDIPGFLLRRRSEIRLVPSRNTSVLFQGVGVKRARSAATSRREAASPVSAGAARQPG
ncbi:2-polyprenyl-6-hydroxyphenyl methylase/3-demethylubiquinone-9 3-methyltransferase [Actinoalloteichus hoggarensis]|uniref:Ubiquinone biosynthesis O-methyltransferase n=1 Tax=Actinoalloteichus hoggarensis TaxID=1470176 RepID=A0A221W2U5_9PSEU|nr:methyltransferase domain-containing protein [Actinoalloteichus hoggarensis]ASO20046.1 Ubiquinone biosynthesis O-methyltransferase [Actinoalloteichus hoggarensis]MBB5919243.1 2-polyprenyl-6-hydroxyphenyl methylase/3-demethylubiquinone-9 3-methyltransferase [Actinoalloteichus hoggarensis]